MSHLFGPQSFFEEGSCLLTASLHFIHTTSSAGKVNPFPAHPQPITAHFWGIYVELNSLVVQNIWYSDRHTTSDHFSWFVVVCAGVQALVPRATLPPVLSLDRLIPSCHLAGLWSAFAIRKFTRTWHAYIDFQYHVTWNALHLYIRYTTSVYPLTDVLRSGTDLPMKCTCSGRDGHTSRPLYNSPERWPPQRIYWHPLWARG